MVASLTVAQERMKEVSGNEAINHNKQAVKADKNAVMKQDQAKEATMNKSNGCMKQLMKRKLNGSKKILRLIEIRSLKTTRLATLT